ncbi:MAG: preprotein translocase subunit SecE [Lachnospiraceae bacterium]|nr:preprotein translocase subunit SecE [Lachnospiraceae bacterium]
MGDSSEKQAKPSYWQGLKAEFRKITWPDKKSTIRQAAVVTVITVILGAIIVCFDALIKYGVNFLMSL